MIPNKNVQGVFDQYSQGQNINSYGGQITNTQIQNQNRQPYFPPSNQAYPQGTVYINSLPNQSQIPNKA